MHFNELSGSLIHKNFSLKNQRTFTYFIQQKPPFAFIFLQNGFCGVEPTRGQEFSWG